MADRDGLNKAADEIIASATGNTDLFHEKVSSLIAMVRAIPASPQPAPHAMTAEGLPPLAANDHPDFVGGIVWSEMEMRAIKEYARRALLTQPAAVSQRQAQGDGAFLSWVADRLVHVYHESPNVDFVLKLRALAAPAQPHAMIGYEHRKAIAEAECIGASDEYFKARTNLMDTAATRNLFEAGFKRGFETGIAQPAAVEPAKPVGYTSDYDLLQLSSGARAKVALHDTPSFQHSKPLFTAPSPDVAAERQVVANCYSNDDGETWCDFPDDIEFVHGMKVGDEYELSASVRYWTERFRVVKVPDDESDEYEVQQITIAQPDAGEKA